MNQEVVVITEDHLRFIYEVLNKPYMVSSRMSIYSDQYADGTFTDIEIEILNDGKKFRVFKIQYNLDDQCETVVLRYEYNTDESFDHLVTSLTDLIESEKFKRLVERENTGGNFEEDKNIVFKTYKSA